MTPERLAEAKLWLNPHAPSSVLEYVTELEQQNKAMREYLLTHDHTLHDAAMQSAKGE